MGVYTYIGRYETIKMYVNNFSLGVKVWVISKRYCQLILFSVLDQAKV